MKTTSIDIYTILTGLGVDEDKAKAAADEILTKTEAQQLLVTKADLANARATIIQWTAGLLIIQAAAIVTLQNLLG
ncbi:hypothetical protein A8B75_00960 [Sphingomonadales bacterium EhC05]|nr:hypothetical protein A8B75_00960 [Sphingomonadales bacterium EhC05]